MAFEKPVFGSPEFNAMYRKKGPRRSPKELERRLGDIHAPVTAGRPAVSANGVKTVRLKNGKVLQFGLKSKNPFAKFKTWQLLLATAGGALLLEYLLVPKGTSIVSKVFTGWGHGEMPTPFGRGGPPFGFGYGGGGGHGGWPYGRGHEYVGAVNRGGYKGGAGMPFGPGPWPTQNAAPPVENGQPSPRPSMPPGPAMDMSGYGGGAYPWWG